MSMLWTWFWTSKCLWKTHWRKNNKKSWNQQQKCCTDLSMHGEWKKMSLVWFLKYIRFRLLCQLWSFLIYFLCYIGMFWYSYIVTNRGMHAMYEKYRGAAFGRCPRVFCQGQPVLPVGLSDLPRNYTVNVFCPRCHGLFFPKSTRQANIDGAYFGTTFPHLYLMTHPVRILILIWFIFCAWQSLWESSDLTFYFSLLYCFRTWYRRNPHKYTFLECMGSKWISLAYFIKITKKGPPKN